MSSSESCSVLTPAPTPLPPPASAFWHLGELSHGQGEVKGSAWEIMAVGRLWRGAEIAELLETTPGLENGMIRNAQLFVGHFDLLPGQVTHVLLPATHASRN